MYANERLLVLTLVSCSLVLAEERNTHERKPKHFLALLGYLHGYKIGQDYAIQFPQYVISPILVLPAVNQQQSVNIQKGGIDDNYQESYGTIQNIESAKLVLNTTASKNETEDIDVRTLKKNYKSTNGSKETALLDATLRQSPDSENKTITNNESIKAQKLNQTTATELNTTKNVSKTETSEKPGPYASSTYNNDKVSSLTLTTPASLENFELPPIMDNRWQNFSLKVNLTNPANKNKTITNDLLNNMNFSSSTSENVMAAPQGTWGAHYKGPYPNALYNNAMIEQLSITTNSYTNGESPVQHDRWGSIPSSANTIPSPANGFKPLAGLYYDGFLHRPLQKNEFIPQSYAYYN